MHGSNIYVGDTWKAPDNFDSAFDKDGNSVDLAQLKVDASKLDTSRAGIYDILYTYDGLTITAKIYISSIIKLYEIVINYEDTSGNSITGSVVKVGMVGERYTIEAKYIKGYILKEVRGNVTGMFKNQTQIVTYVYFKEKNNTLNNEPKPDERIKSKDNK